MKRSNTSFCTFEVQTLNSNDSIETIPIQNKNMSLSFESLQIATKINNLKLLKWPLNFSKKKKNSFAAT